MIPKIIHYCWLSNDPIPEKFQAYMKTWKKYLPDYEFIKWDFTRFDKESSAWVSEAFDNKKYAFAADLIRLNAVYEYGGIYMDMDIEVVKSFDDLLDAPYMLAFENHLEEGIEAGCFGAEKHNPFIKECLNHYTNRHFIKADGSFDVVPLPQIMHAALKQGNFDYHLKSWDYLTCKSFETGIIKTTENSYCIHHFAGSWKTPEEVKVIQDTQKFSQYLGHWLGHNIAEYKNAISQKGLCGIYQLTRQKIMLKANRK